MLAVEQMVLEENEMLRNEGKISVAKEMIKNGMKDEEIIKYTHLSKEKIEKLKAEMLEITSNK